MPPIETVIVGLCAASEPLVNVVEDRIYPEKPPVVDIDGDVEFSSPLPFLVFSQNDAEDAYDLEGNDLGLHWREVIIDIWSKNAIDNYELRELVKTALRVRNANVRLVKLVTEAGIEDELGYHGQQIYRITYKD
jgi:hypothetical protein